MTFFCFIDSDILSVPHMEPLMADDLHDAKIEAETLLGQHASGSAAHVFEDDEKVATIRRDGRSSSLTSDRQAWTT
ncbi:MAG: hypothetical protein EON90_05235 [Brevundimonas sp.]|nr:MAG: hypothetical protein EON90_05235 [Brevundimonas sp.]